MPQYDKSLDYSKLAVESQSQLFRLRSEVDQAGLKYLTPQNQVSHPSHAFKRLHRQQSSASSQQASDSPCSASSEGGSEGSHMNKRCLKLLQKMNSTPQPF